jgi:tetratricopeptide (TPR) repeat protein
MKILPRKIIFGACVMVFVSFIIVNIYFSQTLHPLFFKLVNQPKKSDIVLFLKKIKNTREFPQQLQYFKNIYGQDIEKEVFAQELKRREEIIKLETALKKNEKAKDILVKLAILYFEEGNLNKAREYYQRAKKVDPMIKMKELEKL